MSAGDDARLGDDAGLGPLATRVPEALRGTAAYHVPQPPQVRAKLDANELPYPLPAELRGLWIWTLCLLFMPRILGLVAVLLKREQRQFGGTGTLMLSAVTETVLAVLQAPIRMLAHSLFVLVALGSPKQEWLISKLRRSLPAAWFIGVGMSFSFTTGDMPRAPSWMQRSGLEWVHRLVSEPRRLGKRYLWHDAPFGIELLGRSLLQRFKSERSNVDGL